MGVIGWLVSTLAVVLMVVVLIGGPGVRNARWVWSAQRVFLAEQVGC